METVVLILIFIFIGSSGFIVMKKVDIFLEGISNQTEQKGERKTKFDESKK